VLVAETTRRSRFADDARRCWPKDLVSRVEQSLDLIDSKFEKVLRESALVLENHLNERIKSIVMLTNGVAAQHHDPVIERCKFKQI
jgi:hypothetical protein